MPKPPRLYVFFGLIASGKSTLAEAWAKAIGAGYYNSDRVRKELAGLAPNAAQQDSFNAGIYTPEFSQRTYDALLQRAEAELAAKRTVVLDGSYQAKAERARLKELAGRLGAEFIFILCRCPEELMKERMARRAQDPTAVSDGRWEIYLQQRERFEPPAELAPEECLTIDTDAPVATLVDRLAATLKTTTPQGAPPGRPQTKRTVSMYKRMYLLRFHKDSIDQPIICNLARHYDIEFNILKADIFLQQDGVMVLELSGHKKNLQSGINYLKKQGVKVEALATVINRDEERCFQCGACTGLCPTGALAIKRPEMAVVFDPEKCTGCGVCVTVCPVRAMAISLDPQSISRE